MREMTDKERTDKISINAYKAGIDLEQLAEIAFGNPRWQLVRKRDGLTKHSSKIGFIEWNDDGSFKELYDDSMTSSIDIGRSLIMEPTRMEFIWLTTRITDYDIQDDVLKFKTENSEYELRNIHTQK